MDDLEGMMQKNNLKILVINTPRAIAAHMSREIGGLGYRSYGYADDYDLGKIGAAVRSISPHAVVYNCLHSEIENAVALDNLLDQMLKQPFIGIIHSPDFGIIEKSELASSLRVCHSIAFLAHRSQDFIEKLVSSEVDYDGDLWARWSMVFNSLWQLKSGAADFREIVEDILEGCDYAEQRIRHEKNPKTVRVLTEFAFRLKGAFQLLHERQISSADMQWLQKRMGGAGYPDRLVLDEKKLLYECNLPDSWHSYPILEWHRLPTGPNAVLFVQSGADYEIHDCTFILRPVIAAKTKVDYFKIYSEFRSTLPAESLQNLIAEALREPLRAVAVVKDNSYTTDLETADKIYLIARNYLNCLKQFNSKLN